jgi:hypothetical protein
MPILLGFLSQSPSLKPPESSSSNQLYATLSIKGRPRNKCWEEVQGTLSVSPMVVRGGGRSEILHLFAVAWYFTSPSRLDSSLPKV